MTTGHDGAALLRSAGLRVTQQRLATIAALADRPHADTEDVHRAVRATLPTITLQSLYVVLAALTEAGLIRRIEPAGSPARYELRTGDNHHHVVCTRCGAIADVDCAIGHAPCLTPSHDHGFAITSAEVTYWGLCPTCALTGPEAAPAPAAPSGTPALT